MKLDEFNTLREISAKPQSSQRNLAKKLGFSLGKLNYCVTALKNKGLIKLRNFKNSENKAKYTYLLTSKDLRKGKAYNRIYEKKNERVRRT